MKKSPIPRVLLAGAMAASLGAMLWALASEPVEHGYIRYTGMALQMVESGDWVVPRIGPERIHLAKPPLHHWLIALPIAATGSVASWAGHAPNLVAWALALGFTYAFGLWMFRARDPALLSALVLATSFGFLYLVRGKRLDPLFSATFTAGLYFLFRLLADLEPPRRRLLHAGSAALFLAASTLTKGPLALAFAAIIAVGFVSWSGRRGSTPGLELWAAGALLVGLVGAWPALLVARLGWDGTRSALEAASFLTRQSEPWFHYGVSFVREYSPWTAFVPALAVWLLSERPMRRDGGEPGLRFALTWYGTVFLLLHATGAKHERYLLPLYPAASLLVTALWYDAEGRLRVLSGWPERLRTAGLALLLILVLLLGGALPFAVPALGIDLSSTAFVLAAAAGLGLALGAGLTLRRLLRRGEQLPSLWSAVALVLLVFALFDVGRALVFRRDEAVAARSAALEPLVEGAPVRAFRVEESVQLGVQLLTGRWVASLEEPEAIRAWVRALADQPGERGGPRYVLSDPQGLAALAREAHLDVEDGHSFVLRSHSLVLAVVRVGGLGGLEADERGS